MVRCLTFVLAILFASPALAEIKAADKLPDGVVIAQIKEVSPDGLITSENGSEFTLWALAPADPARYSAFLTGRYVYCYEVLSTEMDCFLYPRKNPFFRTISALVWMPEAGIARVDCKGVAQISFGIALQVQGWLSAAGFHCKGDIASGLQMHSDRNAPLPLYKMLDLRGRTDWPSEYQRRFEPEN